MTLIEKYKDKPDTFKFICDSYAFCECIDEIEGRVVENGEYCGYALKDLDTGKSYFVEQGIRGLMTGTFFIENGIPREIPKPLKDDQIRKFIRIIELGYLKEGYKYSDIPRFIKHLSYFTGRSLIEDNWNRKDEDINIEINQKEKENESK